MGKFEVRTPSLPATIRILRGIENIEPFVMQEPKQRLLGTVLSESEAQQYIDQREMLFEFAQLFDYEEPNERAIAIVGASFIDVLLSNILSNYLIDDRKEVDALLKDRGVLGTYSSRVSMSYCLGLIGKTVASDLKVVGKIRNHFAHEMRATFTEDKIASYCKALCWHKHSLCEPPDGASPRDLYQVGVNQLVSHLSGLVGLALHHKREPSTSGVAS